MEYSARLRCKDGSVREVFTRQIVEGLGGSIAIHNELDLGSTVVEFPLAGPSGG